MKQPPRSSEKAHPDEHDNHDVALHTRTTRPPTTTDAMMNGYTFQPLTHPNQPLLPMNHDDLIMRVGFKYLREALALLGHESPDEHLGVVARELEERGFLVIERDGPCVRVQTPEGWGTVVCCFDTMVAVHMDDVGDYRTFYFYELWREE